MEELLARVRASTRRAAADDPGLVVSSGTLTLDLTEFRAVRDGEQIHLTPIEWRIVETLVCRRGRLVRQAELLGEVRGPGYDGNTNYLRVHIGSIRRKLEAAPPAPRMFVTETGIGYRFVTDHPPS